MLAVASIMGSGMVRVSEVLVVVALKMYLGLQGDTYLLLGKTLAQRICVRTGSSDEL